MNVNTKKPSLKVNILLNGFYQFLILLLPLFTAPYISRVLGSDGVGINSYTLSLMTYFVLFASLGTASYGSREISRNRDNKVKCSRTFWEIETISFLTTCASLLMWLVVCFLYKDYQIYLFILSFQIISTFFNISWFYSGLEKFKYTIGVSGIFKIIGTVMIFVFVKKPDDIWIYMLINSLVVLVGDLSMWIFLPKNLCRSKPELKNIKKHFKSSFMYFIPTIATSIYTVLDKTLIGFITKDESENGFYESAIRIIQIAQIVGFISINGVMSSRSCYLFKNDKDEEAKELCKKTYDITSFLSVGCTFGIIGIAELFVPVFYGDGYEPTILLIYILSFLVIIICLSNVLGSVYYTPAGLRKKSTYYLIYGSVTNLILNLILIPFFGSVGAAVASLIAEFVISSFYIFNARQFISIQEILDKFWKKLLSGVVMMSVLLVMNYFLKSNMNLAALLVIDIFLGFTIYLLSLVVLRDSFIKYIYVNFIKKIIGKFKKSR